MTCRLFTTSRATCRLVDSKVSWRQGSTWHRNKLGSLHVSPSIDDMRIDLVGVLYIVVPALDTGTIQEDKRATAAAKREQQHMATSLV